MGLSNLQTLIIHSLQPIKNNPSDLVRKVLPPDGLKIWYQIQGVIQSPIAQVMLPGVKDFNPDQLIALGIAKLQELPNEFWLELEDCLQGVIEGDPAQTKKAQDLIGSLFRGQPA